MSRKDAAIVADCLVSGDLRGVYSHGVIRVPIYSKRLRRSLFSAAPNISATRLSVSTALIDGDNGMGTVVGRHAVDQAMGLAEETGVGIASAAHSNHYGVASF